MATSWFFATTAAPHPAVPERRAPLHVVWRAWWQRAGERIVAWGDNAHHHRMGSYTRR